MCHEKQDIKLEAIKLVNRITTKNFAIKLIYVCKDWRPNETRAARLNKVIKVQMLLVE